MLQLIYETEWYRTLVGELTIAVKQLNQEAALALVTRNYLIGQLMIDFRAHWEKSPHGDKVVENIAQDIGLSRDYVYRCIQFAEKYPNLANDARSAIEITRLPKSEESLFPTWTYIKTYLLVEKIPCDHEWAEEKVVVFRCSKCGKKKI